jgi:outer membrane protein OmpU
MKHTLLATTALVAMTGAAAAEVTVTATARVGLRTTEGTAAVAANANMEYSTLSAAGVTTLNALEGLYSGSDAATAGGTDTAVTTNSLTLATTAATAADVQELDNIIHNIQDALDVDHLLNLKNNGGAAAQTTLADVTADHITALASAQALRAEMVSGAHEAVDAVADFTDAVNRVRVSFGMSGETDSGIAYGASIRADNSGVGASGTGGSQYVSGAFGKVKMGDLGGADKDAAGHLSGVGLTGLGDHNEIQYQAATHNVGYEYSASGVTFGYSQNTAVRTGSNSAMGLAYSGDMGGASISVGIGQSKLGTATQTTMSASVSTAGFTVKALTSTNDNGITAAVDGVAQVLGGTDAGNVTYVAAVAEANNPDLDSTGISVSYAMDALTMTAFTLTESLEGEEDADFTGFGFAYDMGGVHLKAGVVDNDDQQIIDFGLSFSF